jgi:type IV pilus assembly protein PilN
MARINLLPWREELRKKRQQDFLIAMGAGAVVTCILFAIFYVYIEGLKDYQTRRNQRLKEEIVIVDKKISEVKEIEEKKSKLNEKISLIQSLQASRPKIVHVFDELRKITPVGIYVTSFIQKGNELTIVGKSQSNSRVSEYMNAIDKSLSFTDPKLKFVKGDIASKAKDKIKNQDQMSDFTMMLKVKEDKPANEDEEDAGKKKTKKDKTNKNSGAA